MNKAVLLVMMLLLGLASFAVAVDLPVLPTGAWYDMEETYEATITAEEVTGELTIVGNTHYEVMGTTEVVQDHSSGGTYECYVIEFSGTFNATGEIHYETIDGPIRVQDGSLSGHVYLRVSDFATVKKHRNIQGQVELEASPGYWITVINNLGADQYEEYIPPLQDAQWPLEVGNSWSQDPMIPYFYGTFVAEPLVTPGAFDFQETWAVDMECDVQEPIGDCLTYHILEETSGGTVNPVQDFWYCDDMKFYAKQELSNLWLAGAGQIDFAQLRVTDYELPGDTPTPTPTVPADTPTPTPTVPGDTPTPTPTVPGDTPTPTPSPTIPGENNPPQVLLAGYWTTYLDSVNGGNMTLLAFITDPDGDAIASVDILFQGAATGLTMLDDGSQGDFGAGDSIFGITLPIPGGVPPLQAALEIQATDGKGAQSDLWPYLNVEAPSQSAPRSIMLAKDHDIDWSRINLQTILNGVDPTPKGPNGPFIALGGYWTTDLVVGQAGDLTLIVYVMPYAPGIASVELYFGGVSTGVPLLDNGTSGDFGPGDGIYGFHAPGVVLDTPLQLILEVVATGNDSATSDMWPYLVIN